MEVPRLLEMMPTASDWYFDQAADRHAAMVGRPSAPMSGQGTSIALIGAYMLAGELAAASGDHLRAFPEFENVMRPFVEANQALGLRSAKNNEVGRNEIRSGWLLKQFMRIMPGP